MTHDRPTGDDTLFSDLERELGAGEPAQPSQSTQSNEDPLAELARLIEQNRGATAAPQSSAQASAPPRPPASERPARSTGYSDDLASDLEASLRDMDFASDGDPFAQPGDMASDMTPRPAAPAQPQHPQAQAPQAQAPQADDPFASLEDALNRAMPQPEAPSAGPSAVQMSREAAYGAAAPAAAPYAASMQAGDPAYAGVEPGIQYDEGAPEFETADPNSPYADDGYGYDEEPKSRRGVYVVGALLGLVVIGGAGAYGFKSLISGDGEVPIVRAAGDPAKSVPEQAAQPQQQGKLVYDRIGGNADDPAGGQLVPREEQVAIGTDGRPIRVISGDGAPTAPALGTEGEDDSRRVRTLTVRPDGQIEIPPAPSVQEVVQPVVEQAQQVAQQAVQPPPQPAPSAVATNTGGTQQQPSQLDIVRQNAQREAQSQGVPLPLTRPAPAVGQTQTPVAVAPAQIPQAPVALQPLFPPQAQPVQRQQPANNAIGRGANDAASIQIARAPDQVAAPRQQTNNLPVAVAPAPAAQAAPAAASRPAATQIGRGYVVQVASSSNESDARNALSRVQGSAGGVVGNLQPVVQRADLGSRGIFYRAAFGPISDISEANRVCTRLKSNGIDCFVR